MKLQRVTALLYRIFLMHNYHRFIFICFIFLFSCSDIQRNKTHQNTSVSSIKKGKVLAASYCQSCHMLPDPSWVNSKTWDKGILPNMGPRLGIFYYGYTAYPSYKYDRDLPKGFYPEKPVITNEE